MHYVDLIESLARKYQKWSKKSPKKLMDFFFIAVFIMLFVITLDLTGNILKAILITLSIWITLTFYFLYITLLNLDSRYKKVDIDLEPVKIKSKTVDQLLVKIYGKEEKGLYRNSFLKLLKLEELNLSDVKLTWPFKIKDKVKTNKMYLIALLDILFENLLPKNDNSKVVQIIKEYFTEDLHHNISQTTSKYKANIDPQKEENSQELNQFILELEEIIQKNSRNQ